MPVPLVDIGRSAYKAIRAIPDLARSARLQLRCPTSLLLDRARAVALDGQVLLKDLPKLCREMLIQMHNENGMLEVRNIRNPRVHLTLIDHRIFAISFDEKALRSFSAEQMMVVLKRTTAGMEDGRIYTYRFKEAPDKPVTLQMFKVERQVTVSRLD